jgi:FixJ family two-component response regulator
VTQRSTEQRPSVMVIDDDDDIREGLGSLLRSVGFQFQLFCSVADFLKTEVPDGPTCLVSDVRMPGQSGLDLQRELSN